MLNSLPEKYYALSFQILALPRLFLSMLYKESHYGPIYLMHQANEFVDGVPNIFKFDCDDVLEWCSTYLKTNLAKLPAGKRSLCDSVECTYQSLFINFAFSGKVQGDKDGNVVESSRVGMEGINGKTIWILVADAQNCMLHHDPHLSKSSPFK